MIELDELSTFAGSLVVNTHLKHPLDPHSYPQIVGYTAKVSIAVRLFWGCQIQPELDHARVNRLIEVWSMRGLAVMANERGSCAYA